MILPPIPKDITISKEHRLWLERLRTSLLFTDSLQFKAISVDPPDPINKSSILWLSDGTDSGNDGDMLMKLTNSAGITKIATVVDFNSL